jgi:hypothetical protein
VVIPACSSVVGIWQVASLCFKVSIASTGVRSLVQTGQIKARNRPDNHRKDPGQKRFLAPNLVHNLGP